MTKSIRLSFVVVAIAWVVGLAAAPAEAAPTYAVSLSATPTTLETGEATTLTTTASHDLTGTRWVTYVFDQADPSWYRTCKVQSCSFSVSKVDPGSHTFVAYIARERSDPRYPPLQIQATSNTVTVTWTKPTFTVTLAVDDAWSPPGSTAMLTAEANRDVAGHPFAVQVYDLTEGVRVATCTTGTTCSAFVTQVTPTTHAYQAFVARPATAPPPPDVQASSDVVTVTWSVLPDPTRPPNVGGGPLSGTVAFADGGVPPVDAPCARTDFDFTGTSEVAWLNGSGEAYVGPVHMAGTGGSDCENATAGSGTITLSAIGDNDVGSLSCGSLDGSFTRALSDMSVVVSGDCVINEFEIVRVSFVGKLEVRPTNDGGGVTSPVTDAEFVGAFVVVPD